MKHVLLSALLCASIHCGFAQTTIKAGTVSLTGNLGYARQHEETSSTTARIFDSRSFSAGPSVGYFIADNLAIGAAVGYFGTKDKSYYDFPTDFSSNESRSTQLSGGLFVQYYRMLTEQFGLVGTFTTGYDHSNFTSNYSSTRDGVTNRHGKGNGGFANITPSIIFLPIPRLGLGASLGNIGYSYFKGSSESSSSNATYEPSYEERRGSGFEARFGINYLVFNGTYYFGR